MKKNFTDNKNRTPDITIAGGGWSGIAAAVKLTSEGYQVKLIEASPELGGRARSINVNGMRLDNGQHILLGAYDKTLELIRLLKLKESDLFSRKPLNLKVCTQDSYFQIRASRLPSPLHMLPALLFAKGLTKKEKVTISRLWVKMTLKGFKLNEDTSVSDYLKSHWQSENTIKLFWEPLCIGALNTHTKIASTQIFLTILKKSFTRSNKFSDVLLPKHCLSDIMPTPAAEYINKNNGQVSTNERLQEISIENNAIHNITTSKGTYPVDHLVLATPYQQTLKLLSPVHNQTTLLKQLQQFTAEPITTLYLQYPDTVQIENDMIGLADTHTQWLIDRKSCGQPGLIAAIISSSGDHTSMNKATLTQVIISEIKECFPDWPEPQHTQLIREKNATFCCHRGINHLRPKSGNIGQNIWLAGDYVDTGLPATIEGAVSSGFECAEKLIHSIKQN
ncbi:MAG: NAD(P)-binding protein [Gammaproteobacteria bacterium]|nr:NAD(P)-binding protein [Gammaproteobacteria bacterium]